jgi:hypothetical protein
MLISMRNAGLNRSLLPRGLIVLILLRHRAFVRRMLFGSRKRLVVTIVGFGFLALMLLPRLFTGRQMAVDADQVRLWAPVVLLILVVLQTVARRRVGDAMFQPAELDLVVPGPFTRRQLVLYQIAAQVGPLLLMGAWMGLFVPIGGSYLTTAIGFTLTFQFVNLAVALVGLAMARAGSIAAGVTTAAMIGVITLVGVAVSAAPPRPTGPDVRAWLTWLNTVRASPQIEWLTTPFLPYVESLVAPSLALAWPAVLAAAVINVALIALIVRFDRGDVEELVTSSRHRWDRFLGRGVATSSGGEARAARRSVPMLPRFGGAGSLAWRQLAMAYRSLGPWTSSGIAIAFAVIGYLVGRAFETDSRVAMAPFGMGGAFYASLIIRCDFRSDLAHMALLKSLPIRAVQVFVGQIASAVVLGTVAIGLLFAGVMAGSGAISPWAALAAWAVLTLVYTMLIAIENIGFLILPTRTWRSAVQAGVDPFQTGRQLMLLFVKLLVLGAAAVVIGVPAGIAAAMDSPRGVVLGIGIVMALGVIASLIAIGAQLFSRFNVADETVS